MQNPTPTKKARKPGRRLRFWPARREAVAPSSEAAIMPPYMGDPLSRTHRRARLWLTVGVVLFCLLYGFFYAFFTPYLLPVLLSPLLALLLAVIWALPDMRRPPVTQMELLFFATMVALVIWPGYLAIALPGLPWITVARLTGFPFAFYLTVCVSTSQEFRQDIGRALRAAPVISWLAVAFCVIEFLSIFMSNQKAESIEKYAILQVFGTGVFFASVFLFTRAKRADTWAKLLWAMAAPVGIIALIEHKVRHVLWMGHVPGFLQINDPMVQNYMKAGGRRYTDIYRAQATFSTALGLAEYLALTTPFIMHYMLYAKQLALRLAAGVSVPFVLVAILASGSRLGMVGFGLAVIIYVLVWALVRRQRNPGDLIASAVVYAYPVIFTSTILAIQFVGRLHKMFLGGGNAQASTQARITQWHMGVPLIMKNPLGYGIGRGAETLGYLDPGGGLTIDSYYLLVLLDYGVIGFIVYYGMLASRVFLGLRAGVKLPRQDSEVALVIPASISLAAFLVIKSVFSNTDNHSLSFMLIGMVCALIYRARQERAQTVEPPAALVSVAPPASRAVGGVATRPMTS